MAFDLTNFCILPHDTIRQAIASIDRNAKGIVLVTDAERHLLGTVTDGDIRRAILRGQPIDDPVQTLLTAKGELYQTPVTALAGTDPLALLRLMQERVIRQVPLLDEHGCVVDLATVDDLGPESDLPLQAVIMAGGFGTRLAPLTDDVPKPMLPVGGRPLMELIIQQLRQAGIHRVNISTHHMPEKIIGHFGDGGNFGVELRYIAEETPLGTGGALGIMPESPEPLLVMNGDILTRMDFRAMLDYHREHAAMLTVAVRKIDVNVPYGVIEVNGPLVKSVVEKPVMSFFVNAGIYLLEPAAQRYVPPGQRFDMTDLIQALLNDQQAVACFPIHEYWLDIGQHLDYQQAQQDLALGKL